MADDFELVDEPVEDTHPIDKRINKVLSDRNQALAEKEAEVAARQKAEAEAAEARKEAEFFKNFATSASKYPSAAEYQEKIREKVMSGYDMEDAIVSTLNREGKFAPEQIQREFPAGGSAANTLQASSDKPVRDMNREELRAALIEAERRGDIGLT